MSPTDAPPVRFVDRTDDAGRFFATLPPDWQGDIVPRWPSYRGAARVFTFEGADDEVLGGGIVFDRVSPDTEAYRGVAEAWFAQGHRYVGFLWIAEHQRGRSLGSRWLAALRTLFPEQPFWLSVEDEGLVPFYERNGFRRAGTVQGPGGPEWILASGPM